MYVAFIANAPTHWRWTRKGFVKYEEAYGIWRRFESTLTTLG